MIKNIYILLLLFFFFCINNAEARRLVIPDGLQVPISFDQTLKVNNFSKNTTINVSVKKDVFVEGIKIFSLQNKGYAKIEFKEGSFLKRTLTNGLFGDPKIIINEVIIYDDFKNPHTFLLSKSNKKIKSLKKRQSAYRIYADFDSLPYTAIFNAAQPLDMQISNELNIIGQSKILYGFHVGPNEIDIKE